MWDKFLFIVKNFKIFFTYLLISHSVDELQAAAYGSVFDTITTITFQEQSISLPDEQKIQEFEKQIESYFEKIESNTKQIQTLENLRDTLLTVTILSALAITAFTLFMKTQTVFYGLEHLAAA